MKKNLAWTLFMITIMLTGILFFNGCDLDIRPDLVPANPGNWVGFCDIDNSGRLVVHIKNQGLETAESSYVEVDFASFGDFVKLVPAIPAGNTATVTFNIPSGCFNPDCGFEITVDIYDEVDESNELNNSEIGNCIG